MRGPGAAIAIALVASAPSAHAHDMWLEGATAGSVASAHLWIGEDLVGEEEKTFEPAKFTRLELRSASGPLDLLAGSARGAPVVQADRLGRGEFLFVADRAPVRIELAPSKFEQYLKEEGLDAIIAERARRGESGKPGRERYTRHLKSLVRTEGASFEGLAARLVGQRLEIVVDGDLGAGSPLGARIRFDGRALPGVRVSLVTRAEGASRVIHAASNDDGKASFVVPAKASFVEVRLVHMRRCAEKSGIACLDADWESTWASFTFARQ